MNNACYYKALVNLPEFHAFLTHRQVPGGSEEEGERSDGRIERAKLSYGNSEQ